MWAQAANARLPAAPPPKLVDTRIVIALDQRISLGYLPLTIAAQRGYFREEGLDVELREFADPAQAMAAVGTGGAHVLCGPYVDLLAWGARGQGLGVAAGQVEFHHLEPRDPPAAPAGLAFLGTQNHEQNNFPLTLINGLLYS